MHSRWLVMKKILHCNFHFIYILWTDYSFKFLFGPSFARGGVWNTVLRRFETALLGIVGLCVCHVVTGAYSPLLAY